MQNYLGLKVVRAIRAEAAIVEEVMETAYRDREDTIRDLILELENETNEESS